MKRKNIVGDQTREFTRRQYKHFLKHGPAWRYHYQDETRRRVRFIADLVFYWIIPAITLILVFHAMTEKK